MDYQNNKEHFYKGINILFTVNNKCYNIGTGSLESRKITSFTLISNEKINKYICVLGNNDVPYPYVITNKNVYFILEDSVVPLHALNLNSQNYPTDKIPKVSYSKLYGRTLNDKPLNINNILHQYKNNLYTWYYGLPNNHLYTII